MASATSLTAEPTRISTGTEIGVPGIQEYSGILDEEILRKLRWPYSNYVYREMMDNDATIGSMLFAIEMLIRGVEWTVEPADDRPESIERAEILRTMMDDMEKPWCEVINDILSFLPYGYSVNELVYKRRNGENSDPRFSSKHNDGYWAWRKLPTRAQDTICRWEFLRNEDGIATGNLKGVWQQPPQGGREVFIPTDRFLLFRVNSKKDNPESKSILRNAYLSWYFKKRITEIEAVGIERDLAGVPAAFIPPIYMSEDADVNQRAVYNGIKELITSIRNNEQAGIVFPQAYDERGNKLFDLKLLGRENGSGKSFDTETVIQRYDKRIAGTVLADFILLGQQSVGSFALSSDKTKLFAAAIGAWLQSISAVFNSQALPRLWRLNEWSMDTMPRIGHGDIEKMELDTVSQYFERLTKSGAVLPDQDLEEWLRDQAGAPQRSQTTPVLLEETEEITNGGSGSDADSGSGSGSGGEPGDSSSSTDQDDVEKRTRISNRIRDFFSIS